jgi:penicillin-binding protein 2
MKQYGELFGLNSKTGIDIPHEQEGFLPSPEWKQDVKEEAWYIGDTYHMAIGQGDVLVTPLQVSNYMAAFANGGTMYQPRLVRATIPAGETRYTPRDAVILHKDFINSYAMSVIRGGLRETVVSGSARSLASLPVSAAGKTGTAQWGTDKKPHAWFTGFAPYEKPEVVITVLIEEAGEGSSVSVPVARDFLQWYFGTYKKR